MTFKAWLADLWLDIRYGRWEVLREFSHYRNRASFRLAPIKAEGCEVEYDQNAVYVYFAICRRTKDMVLCDSKREAEGVVAIHNDSRGLEDTNPNGC